MPPFTIFSRITELPRKRADEGYVQQKVSLPATLMARFQRLYWDAVLGKTKYGAISDVLTALLLQHVNTLEQGQPEPLFRKMPDGTFQPIIPEAPNVESFHN